MSPINLGDLLAKWTSLSQEVDLDLFYDLGGECSCRESNTFTEWVGKADSPARRSALFLSHGIYL